MRFLRKRIPHKKGPFSFFIQSHCDFRFHKLMFARLSPSQYFNYSGEKRDASLFEMILRRFERKVFIYLSVSLIFIDSERAKIFVMYYIDDKRRYYI